MVSPVGYDFGPNRGSDGATIVRSWRSVQKSGLLVLMRVLSWTALVKAGLVTGAALGAASRYLVSG
jgi:hypothetical protein